jgi:hypothetical protein
MSMSVFQVLEKRVSETPDFEWWRPKVGDVVSGFVVKRFAVKGRYGERDVLLVQLEDSTRIAIAMTTVLQEDFRNVESGWYVAIRFAGKQGQFLRYVTAKMSPEEVQKVRTC